MNRSHERMFGVFSDNRKSKIQNQKWAGLFALVLAFALGRGEGRRRSRQGKSSASVSWMQALLLVARSSWRRSGRELSKLGWIEGKNITIEYRFAEQKTERLPELAADLVRLKVDLIVVTGAPPALAAKSATTTIPIVMTTAPGPRGCRFGCQSGAAGRQCHRVLEFSRPN